MYDAGLRVPVMPLASSRSRADCRAARLESEQSRHTNIYAFDFVDLKAPYTLQVSLLNL